MKIGRELVAKARVLALRAHQGQVDKAGEPYMGHIDRVAARVSDDPAAEVVALLHDALEDNQDPSLRKEILALPPRLLHSIWLLNRSACPKRCYLLRIAADELACRVKLADMQDNSDPARLAVLPAKTARRLEAKYRQGADELMGYRRALLTLAGRQ